jgi:hypothetical protein
VLGDGIEDVLVARPANDVRAHAGRSLGDSATVNAVFRSPPLSGSRPGPVRFVAAGIRAEAASRSRETTGPANASSISDCTAVARATRHPEPDACPAR